MWLLWLSLLLLFVKGPRSLGSISNSGDGSSGSSLKSLVTRGKANQISGSSPFATEITSTQLRNFEELERQLTSYMTEKTSLEEELGRLILISLLINWLINFINDNNISF